MSAIQIGLADDHKLFRRGMAELINNFTGYHVSVEANNGRELLQWLTQNTAPDIILLDIKMPEMDGYQTALELKEKFPSIKILALSMYDDEKSIIKMIKSGARGYILKDTEPTELKRAFDDLMRKGYYYSELVSSVLAENIRKDEVSKNIAMSDREVDFLRYACSELTYKEIADKMNLAPRTIDGYREALFEKLNVKSRVGLVMYAIKNGVMKVD